MSKISHHEHYKKQPKVVELEKADKNLKKAVNTDKTSNLSSNPIDNIVNQIEGASGVSAAKVSHGHSNNPYPAEKTTKKTTQKINSNINNRLIM